MVKDLIKLVGLCLALENSDDRMISKSEEIVRLNEMMDRITDKKNTKKAA